jgi:hypothetical protein
MDLAAFDKPRAMLTANTNLKTAVLFEEHFDKTTFAKQWRATDEKDPCIAFVPIVEKGSTALRIRSTGVKTLPNDNERAAYETVKTIASENLVVLQADADFRSDDKSYLEICLSGSSGGIRMRLQPHSPRGINEYINFRDKRPGQLHASRPGMYESGELYRCVLSVDRRRASVEVLDGINLAGMDWFTFDNFTLSDLGDDIRLELRYLRYVSPGECKVYRARVRGAVEIDEDDR